MRLLLLPIHSFLTPAMFAQGLTKVGQARARRVMRFTASADRCRSLCASLLLTRALADAGVPPSTPLAHTKLGKPFCPARQDLHFSLAHCGEYAACAMHSQPCGVDVEPVADAPPQLLTASLHPQEQQELHSLPSKERAVAFARMWTRKEALLKLLGVGLSIDPRTVNIPYAKPHICLNDAHFIFQDYELPAHALSLCLPQGTRPPDPEFLSPEELL